MLDNRFEFVPNDFEKAIIENDNNAIKNYLLNTHLMRSLGYTEEELKRMRNAAALPQTVKNEKERITSSPKINSDYKPKIEMDDAKIASKLYHIQGNKNRASEYYCVKYLQRYQDMDEEAKNEEKREGKLDKLLNTLCKIYIGKENNFAPRKKEFMDLIETYPEALEAGQPNRSFYIECLYEEGSTESLDKLYIVGNTCAANGLTLEKAAAYKYAIILARRRSINSINYFLENRLHEMTNTTLMRQWLTYSVPIIKDKLDTSGKKKQKATDNRQDLIEMLRTLAKKASSEDGNGAYDIVLMLNREFGNGIGFDYDGLTQLYLDSRGGENPFEAKGWGTYLYALAEEYKRQHGSLQGFTYQSDYEQLQKLYHQQVVNKLESLLLKERNQDYSHIKNTLAELGKSIKTGNNGNKILSFWPQLEQEVVERFEENITSYLERLSLEYSNRYDVWKKFRMNECLNTEAITGSEQYQEEMAEAAYYAFKKIMLSPEDSRDCWYMLARIYYARMEELSKALSISNQQDEKDMLYFEIKELAEHAFLCLYYRAYSQHDYDDWTDLNNYCYILCQWKFKNECYTTEWLNIWRTREYETKLEVFQYIQNDPETSGKHFADLWTNKGESEIPLLPLLKRNIPLARKYIEEFAKLYERFHQYRFVKHAYFIADQTEQYECYLKEFSETLLRTELIQMNIQLLRLLRLKKFHLVDLYFEEISKKATSVPRLLKATRKLYGVYKISPSPSWLRKLEKLLEHYPISSFEFEQNYWNADSEVAIKENILALRFALRIYKESRNYTEDIDLGLLNYKLYEQYYRLYSENLCTDAKKTALIRNMYKYLYSAAEDGGNLFYCYELIALCYRHYDVLENRISEASGIALTDPEQTKKKDYYRDNFAKLYQEIGDRDKDFFGKLCEISLNSNYEVTARIRDLVKHYFKESTLLDYPALHQYLGLINNIDVAVLQLYFCPEYADDIQITTDKIQHFPKALKLIELWQEAEEEGLPLVNRELFYSCLSDLDSKKSGSLAHKKAKKRAERKADVELRSNRSLLLLDYLEHSNEYSTEALSFLHLFFDLLGGLSITYPIIDSINAGMDYQDDRCFQFYKKLYSKCRDLECYTSLARQYAKGGDFENAKQYYDKVISISDENEALKKQYQYVQWQKLAVELISMAQQGEEIRLGSLSDTNPLFICRALGYNCYKNPDYIDLLMQRLIADEDKNLLNYIRRVIIGRHYNDGEELLEELRKLRGTVYFNILLVDLYRTTKETLNFELFDEKESLILKEANQEQVFIKMGMRYYGRRIFMQQKNNPPHSKHGVAAAVYTDAYIKSLDNKSLIQYLLEFAPELAGNQAKIQLYMNFLKQGGQTGGGLSEPGEEHEITIRRFKVQLAYHLFLDYYQRESDANNEWMKDMERYRQAMNYLHEAVLFLGNNKTDYADISVRLRSSYVDMLRVMGVYNPDYTLEIISTIIYDLKRLQQVFYNPNNPDSVFLKEFLANISNLNTYEAFETMEKRMVALEDCIDNLKHKQDYRYQDIVSLWKKMLYQKLLALRSLETIKNRNYLIGRKIAEENYVEFFDKRIKERKNIKLTAVRGMGLSSILHCYFDKELIEGIKRKTLFLFMDCNKEGIRWDLPQLKKELSTVLDKAIHEIELHDKQCADTLMKAKQGDILDTLEELSLTKPIQRVYVIMDHFERLLESDSRDALLKLLLKLQERKVLLITASDTDYEFPGYSWQDMDFASYELEPFDMEEMKQYVKHRLTDFGIILDDGHIERIFHSTGGVPAQVAYYVDYIRNNPNTHDKGDFLMSIIPKLKGLFARWEQTMDENQLKKFDSGLYSLYHNLDNNNISWGTDLVTKQGEDKPDDVMGKLTDALKDVMDGAANRIMKGIKEELKEANTKLDKSLEYHKKHQEDHFEQKMEHEEQKKELEVLKENDKIMIEKLEQLLSKIPPKSELPRDPENKDQINLSKYGDSVQETMGTWIESAEINKQNYNLSEGVWKKLSNYEAVYQFLKYGEAMRLLEGHIKSKDYDYSVLSLFYCLAMEKLMNELFYQHVKSVIPEVDYKGVKIKDWNEEFTLGNFVHYFRNYKEDFILYAGLDSEKRMIYDGKFRTFTYLLSNYTAIRNDVAHPNKAVLLDRYQKLLYYMLGDKKYPYRKPEHKPLVEQVFEIFMFSKGE